MEIRDLSEHMADLARDLRSEEGEEQTLQHIVDAAVELIGPCEAAGITMATRQGEVRSSAASSRTAARSDAIQREQGEGPCIDAVWAHRVISVPDLSEETRWPKWSAVMSEELGVRSMLCVRLFTHENRVGALNLFSSEPHQFDEDEEQEAVAIAAHAAVAAAAAENIEQLTTAIGNRTLIGQATGMIMVQYDLTGARAFSVLRRLSSEQNRKLSAIAQELVTTWDAALHRQ